MKKPFMRPCFHTEILTPKKVPLNGIWVGPRNAKRVIVWMHGLASNMFSKLSIADELVDSNTAVLTFSNRGSGYVVAAKRGKKRLLLGAGHEVFTDCIDDIEGAIRYAKQRGARELYLAGHSTGCQKSIYWAGKGGRGIKGIILLAPVSDYAAEVRGSKKSICARAERIARNMVRNGKKHELLPAGVWHETIDAQRYLSLYTADSIEQSIFSYFDQRRPKFLSTVKLPILALLAECDEFADRSAREMADWFEQYIYTGEVAIVPKVEHGFKGAEREVAKLIRNFMKES